MISRACILLGADLDTSSPMICYLKSYKGETDSTAVKLHNQWLTFQVILLHPVQCIPISRLYSNLKLNYSVVLDCHWRPTSTRKRQVCARSFNVVRNEWIRFYVRVTGDASSAEASRVRRTSSLSCVGMYTTRVEQMQTTARSHLDQHVERWSSFTQGPK